MDPISTSGPRSEVSMIAEHDVAVQLAAEEQLLLAAAPIQRQQPRRSVQVA
jgi:hypothetical protein